LLRAACEVFAERGYSATSIEEIVRRARVSRTAFYMFFENKDDCMLGVFSAGIEAIIPHFREVAESDLEPVARIHACVEAIVGGFAADPPMARVLLVEAVGTSPRVELARGQARAEFARVIREQMEASGLWDGRSTNEMAMVAMATMAGIAENVGHLVVEGRVDQWRGALPALQGFALRALAPELGRI